MYDEQIECVGNTQDPADGDFTFQFNRTYLGFQFEAIDCGHMYIIKNRRGYFFKKKDLYLRNGGDICRYTASNAVLCTGHGIGNGNIESKFEIDLRSMTAKGYLNVGDPSINAQFSRLTCRPYKEDRKDYDNEFGIEGGCR